MSGEGASHPSPQLLLAVPGSGQLHPPPFPWEEDECQSDTSLLLIPVALARRDLTSHFPLSALIPAEPLPAPLGSAGMTEGVGISQGQVQVGASALADPLG